MDLIVSNRLKFAAALPVLVLSLLAASCSGYRDVAVENRTAERLNAYITGALDLSPSMEPGQRVNYDLLTGEIGEGGSLVHVTLKDNRGCLAGRFDLPIEALLVRGGYLLSIDPSRISPRESRVVCGSLRE